MDLLKAEIARKRKLIEDKNLMVRNARNIHFKQEFNKNFVLRLKVKNISNGET